MRKKIIFVSLSLASLVLLILLFISGGKTDTPEILTTNLNVEKREIQSPEEEKDNLNENYLISFFSESIQTLRNSLRDNALSLVAAANPSTEYVRVAPGMRKEEIAELLQKKLSWNESDKKNFLDLHEFVKTENAEGYYYPGGYIIPEKSTGLEVAKLMVNRFNEEVMARYASSTAKIVNIDTALKIASIIERESAGTKDMRLISGIVWNRIFKDMSLDIDATLQYAKGTGEKGWWPKVIPEDKFIESPYNTYQNKGLTPTPISNPNLAAIEAALNPKKTTCLFYLHDKYRRIHCSATYKEHVRNIQKYYK